VDENFAQEAIYKMLPYNMHPYLRSDVDRDRMFKWLVNHVYLWGQSNHKTYGNTLVQKGVFILHHCGLTNNRFDAEDWKKLREGISGSRGAVSFTKEHVISIVLQLSRTGYYCLYAFMLISTNISTLYWPKICRLRP
jgi:hypothetical protein